MPNESRPAAARTIDVTAPSRLHFGLLAPAANQRRRYGGVGVMVRPPQLRLRLEAAPEYQLPAQCELARRIHTVVERMGRQQNGLQMPPVRICVPEQVPLHAGLGAGTQLAMATAWALLSWQQGEPAPRLPQRLAGLSGRGERSAVGVYGFCQGGWIVEPGKTAAETLSPLEERLENPSPWRWLLLRPKLPPGRSGSEEQQIFHSLPPAPEITRRLQAILQHELLPALRAGHFEATAQALGRYSRTAGEPFAAVQGGLYAHPQVERLVERLHRWGYAGAGQSSWGPTVFVLLPHEQAAAELIQQLEHQWPEPLHAVVAATDTLGATMHVA